MPITDCCQQCADGRENVENKDDPFFTECQGNKGKDMRLNVITLKHDGKAKRLILQNSCHSKKNGSFKSKNKAVTYF